MMENQELQMRLADIYAGDELAQEMEDVLSAAAFLDKDLSHDMATLRHTVKLLRTTESPEFTEESFQRILMKLYAKTGVDVQPNLTAPSHMQYYLPIAG